MSSPRRQLAIVMNPTAAAGKPLRLLPQVRRELEGLALPFRVIETRDAGHASEEALRAAESGETVVALGGDGLVGALGGALRGAGPLGILPGGRGNDFARSLGIPADIPGACRLLAEGDERTLDLGEANGRPFVSIASTGYDSEANRIANEARFVRGRLVYAYAGIRALARWRPAHFTVRLDKRTLTFEGYTVATANSRYYGGGMQVAPRADPSDGLLDVIMIEHSGKLRFLSKLPKVFAGTHLDVEGVRTDRAREVEISADRPFAVYADGDPLTELPATVRIIPGALHVIAPG